jgi:tetratricopeptide (TPR) repeat protein
MKFFMAALILIMSAPSAYSVDRGGSAPVAPTPNVESSTPTPVSTPTPFESVAAKSLGTELTAIRALLAGKNYSAALTALKSADKSYPNNADINNLLGYSARNLKQYKAAATYYTKALKINPSHLGALEYQGELFILTKKTNDAKKNLAKLKSLCGVSCEEYLDLKKAIGNK